MAEASEVTVFASLAPLQMDELETVRMLSGLLQNNVSVDGRFGNTPKVVKMDLRSAEGPVNSTQPAYADVSIEVDYPNDKKATRHEIHVRALNLDGEGFTYTNVIWNVQGTAKWSFNADQTQPDGAKAKVSADGWSSDQATFESATDPTLRLVVEKPGGKKRTPGFDLLPAVAAIASLLVLVRRRW